MVILGISGLLLLALMMHFSKASIAATTKDDRRLLEAPTVHEGERLCRAVEQRKWCVTLADLQQFKRLVHEAVVKGTIKPTDRDMFDVSDVRTGPSAYTVCEQFIKPVTAAAWANQSLSFLGGRWGSG